MKLIKISLLSFAFLHLQNIFTSDEPANTGAAKASKWSARTAPAQETMPHHGAESFPALPTAAARHVKPRTPAKIDLSESERPIHYEGVLPDISEKRGEYKPGILPAMLFAWYFPATKAALENKLPVDARSVEKACAEARLSIPKIPVETQAEEVVKASKNILADTQKFNPLEIAEFAKQVENNKVDINPAYWGDLHAACKDNKERKSIILAALLEDFAAEIQSHKDGEIASLKGYARANGSGRSSPPADYGIGAKFEGNKVAALQQLVAKVFEISDRKSEAAKVLSDTDTPPGTPDFGKK